jgi:hypothetical protein
MSTINTQHSMSDEADRAREMALTCVVARKIFPDEAFVQSYLIARFLRDPKTFHTNKRLLEFVLRRRIQLTKPYTYEAFAVAIDRAEQAGHTAKIFDFPSPPKRD